MNVSAKRYGIISRVDMVGRIGQHAATEQSGHGTQCWQVARAWVCTVSPVWSVHG